MKDVNKICLGCMRDKNDSTVCPHCGFDLNTYEAPQHHLKPKTILNGKYMLGKSIGEGGFGITYIGWDLNLEIKVAIKEYFPNGFVSRDISNTDTVTIFSSNNESDYEVGKTKFIEEAKALAKFDNLPGIVSVKDFFLENGTAYIAMEFVEGETLKDFLKRNGGKTLPENIFTMMKPLMKSLIEVHKKDIIHRDISPDNIMITKDSQVKLLDFGAAREVSADGNKSLSIQLKPGYAPEEQYRSHGKQGPWTDVYALCATMYRAITGVPPVESLERLQNDTLQRPSQMGINIDPVKETALIQGMAVFADNRFHNVEALYNALYGDYVEPVNTTVTPDVRPVQNSPIYNTNTAYQNQPKSSNGAKIALIIVVCFVALVVVSGSIFIGTGGLSELMATPTPVPTEAPTPTPTPIPKPVFNNISASTTRGSDYTEGIEVNYFPEYAIDKDITTTWSPDRNIELTPTITLSSGTKQHVSGIKMSNGYFKSEKTYTRNRRITKVQVEYEGGSKIQDFDINQYRIMQDVKFDAPVDTAYIKIKVLDSYYGDWKDICISEIEVY